MDLEDAKIAQAYLLSEARDITVLKFTPTALEPVVVRTQNYDEPGSIISKNIKPDAVNFLELPEELLQILTPEIKVFKLYSIGDKEFAYQLPQGRIEAEAGGTRKTIELPVIKSVEFTKLGGNPAEINTNIKFNIKLFARDISSYFTRTSIGTSAVLRTIQGQMNEHRASAENPALPNPATSIRAYQDLRNTAASLKDGISWIDLIKINPGDSLSGNTELVTSEIECRIKVEIGYALSDTAPKPPGFVGSDAAWERWREAIIAQREIFNLSLFKHEFEFNGYDGVGLSVDFIASGNAKQLTPLADLFSNPASEAEIEAKRSTIRFKKKEAKKASEDSVAAEESREANVADLIDSCKEQLDDEIAELKLDIKKIKARVRTALLSQLYLDLNVSLDVTGTDRTRVWYRKYDYSSKDGAPRNKNVSHRYRPGGGISVGGTWGRVNITDADINAATGEEEITVETEEGEVTTAAPDSPTTHTNGFDAYIFLGDIIEAAFEVLVPGGAHTEITRSRHFNRNPFWRGMTLVAAGGKYVFESPFTHTAGASGVALGAEIPNKDRAEHYINEFGGYLLGLVTYPDPLDTTESITVTLSNLPISLDLFRGWWLDSYVATGKKSLSVRDFLTALMRFVQEDVFRGIPYEEGDGEVPDDTPKFVINNIVPKQRMWNAVYPQYWGNLKFPNAVSITADGSDAESPLALNTLTVIEQIDNARAIPEGTAKIIFGETDRGILKKLSFEREDIPGHAEARLFSDRESMAGNIALREKYNTSMETIGTTAVSPGSLVFLDPKPLDLGYTGADGSLAKSLGLGGLYRVVSLTSTLDFSGAGNSWNTKIKTKWESFGDGSQGTEVNQLEGSVGNCSRRARHHLEAMAAAEAQAILEAAAPGVSDDLQIDDTPVERPDAGDRVVNPETGQTLDELEEAFGMNPAQGFQG